MNLCCMRAICSASGRGVLIKAGGGVSAGSGRFSVLSCSGSPLPVDDAEVVLATTGVGGASPSAEVDGLSLSDRAAPALCTSAVGCPANKHFEAYVTHVWMNSSFVIGQFFVTTKYFITSATTVR